MFGIHGVGRGRADYYLSDLARELPASDPGHWAGGAAAGLGLEGPVEPADFHRLLQGRHPRTGGPIGSGRTTVAAFDLTFSAPKSASVLFALGGEAVARRVVAAHSEAVEGALSYLEHHAVTAARRDGVERTVIPTTGIVAGQFTHAVNRNGDPHLHSHLVMANVVHGTDGRWSACDRRGLEAHRHAASAVFEAHLRACLSSGLGVRWSAVPGRSAEIVDVRPHLLGEFSTRSADIRRHMHEIGARSGRARRVAWAATRPEKPPGSPYAEAAAEWERRAHAVDVPLELVLDRQVPGRGGVGRALLDEHRFAAVISLTPHGGARRRDVVAAFGAAATDGVAAGSLERLVGHWVRGGPVGVAEPLQPRRAVLPANHHLRALGPRPVDPQDHELWVGAARALDAYRDRWGLSGSVEPLGTTASPELASLPTARLADFVRTRRHLDAVRTRLGRGDPVGVDLGLVR
jgi:conjugative relaxase-like TrwC/TraI family protein